jgi:hypothetical protein
MSKSLYLYTQLNVSELSSLMENFQKQFDEFLADSFTEEELEQFEQKLDQMAEVVCQPILAELTFEDLTADPAREEEQKKFFEKSRSSICLDHLPYLETNPFQVTYLKDLLNRLGEVLIDQGGVTELKFKNDYLMSLNRYGDASKLAKLETYIPEPRVKTKAPVDPIDFLVHDVYREMNRVKKSGTLLQALEGLQEQNEKTKKLFFVMREEDLDSDGLLRKSGMNAKDFDDYLEKLKFYLKKY